jgi:transcriptional regulator with XRE-family HTH domain
MVNLASVLKAEIRRLARSEARAAVSEIKKSLVKEKQRSAQLRKQLAEQKKEIAALRRGAAAPARAAAPAAEEGGANLRWRKDTIAVLRKKHDLSQAALAKLVGVGLNTVWSWEKGRTAPRRKQLEAIAAVRGMGKRELLARLQELGLEGGRQKPGRKPGSTAKKAAKKKTAKKAAKKVVRKKAARKTAKKTRRSGR